MSTANPRSVPFMQALARGGMVLDGAMGTALYERGVLYSQGFDQVSLARPDLVRQVHESYLRAGADLISTNSFGANRFRLATHALEGEVERINQRRRGDRARSRRRQRATSAARLGRPG